jgi:glycosyltransferase involved in cell wall biosynthesis
MKLFAITFGDERGASARMRLLQYAEHFKRSGDELIWIPKAKFRPRHLAWAAKADVIINQECLLPTAVGWMLKSLGKPMIFEWDDALYTRPGKPYWGFTQMRVLHRLHWWLRHANVVTAPSQYLAAYSRRYARAVEIIPMAMPITRAGPRKAPGENITLGWVAGPANFRHIKAIGPDLEAFLNAHPNAQLKIMSGMRPDLKIPFEFVPWAPGTDETFLQEIDLGLLPLPDEEFTRGKSPLKALMYAAHGVPIIASNVGGGPGELCQEFAAISVPSTAGWRQALERALEPKIYTELSLLGLERARANHEIGTVFEKFHTLLERVAQDA